MTCSTNGCSPASGANADHQEDVSFTRPAPLISRPARAWPRWPHDASREAIPLSLPTEQPTTAINLASPLDGHLQRTVHIDWDYLVVRRPVVLTHSTLPAYLLLPEVHALLDRALHANHHLMINTLWHTGARISECLSLTRANFHLAAERSYVSLHVSKRRGRPRTNAAGDPVPRLLPITDHAYLLELDRYFTTHRLKANDKLFPIGRHGAAKRVRTLVERVKKEGGVDLPIKVTAHTFRHSFAINAVLHGVPLPVIKQWLGHRNIQSTEIYTQVLAAETGHLMQWIAF